MNISDVQGRRRLLRPSVLAWTVLAAIIVSFVVVVLAADGASSLAGRVGGDFPAFYGAGSIVAAGDTDHLYDIDRQAQAERGLVGDGEVLYFAYPPPVAAAYAALAVLPYVTAYVVHTVLMAAALVGAFLLIRPMLPTVRPPGPVVAAAASTFVPVFMAVTLGQNSAILVLLVAASWRFARDGRDELVGLALGLLLYKPQYAVPLIGLHLVRGRWRVVAASAAMAAGWWFLGAAMLGRSWTADWIAQVSDFTAIDAEINGANAISWLGAAEHVFGVGSTFALVLGGTLAMLTAAGLVVVWWRRGDDHLALPMAAASAGILLTSPHAMFYDSALLTLTVAGLAVVERGRMWWIVSVGWVLGALHPLKGALGLTPVTLLVVTAFAVTLRTWWRERTPAAVPAAATRVAWDG